MESLTYKDIIDDKITEWQNGLRELEGQVPKASAAAKVELKATIEHLRSAIFLAIVQLRNLDKNETVDNTLETKDKILKIFASIDTDFPGYVSKTPFML